jgi:hypothetical protein
MSVYKEIFFPTEENHTIELPKNMFGKEVEVIFTVRDSVTSLPKSKKQSLDKLFEHFGKGKEFPSLDEIRKNNWSRKW